MSSKIPCFWYLGIPNLLTSKIFLRFIYLMYMSALPLSSDTPEAGIRPITNGCEAPCGCWEMNAEPLEEQTVLLTAEPSLNIQNL